MSHTINEFSVDIMGEQKREKKTGYNTNDKSDNRR